MTLTLTWRNLTPNPNLAAEGEIDIRFVHVQLVHRELRPRAGREAAAREEAGYAHPVQQHLRT